MEFEPIDLSRLDRPWTNYRVFISNTLVKRTTHRVPGGYMHRWLIREEREEPTMYINHEARAIYCNPQLMPRLLSFYAGAKRG